MANQKDKIVPVNRDMVGHRIHSVGESPTKRWMVDFAYEDGSVRRYDGEHWSVIEPSVRQSRG